MLALALMALRLHNQPIDTNQLGPHLERACKLVSVSGMYTVGELLLAGITNFVRRDPQFFRCSSLLY
jgi:hypothetical protein